MNKDIIFGFKLASVVFFTIFSIILPIMLFFYIVEHPIWWLWLFGLPGLFALITLETYICGYLWGEWTND